ncbi:hypothetical protein ACFPYI_15025 [Halomarina salina]|uniref:Uncharacterized protein n=1 Tax=Halomarina salina TaxID=1872699 RepID=A0ABD5RQ84_9EURY|nr:hypothetical protein [Halomarina salina]
MSSLDPQWTSRLDKQGAPRTPLRADSIRNGLATTLARGITTDVYLRGGYLSGFAWATHQISNHPEASDESVAEQKAHLRTFEEILAMASYRYQQTHDPPEGVRGMTGGQRIGREELWDEDPVDLSEIELLQSSYAIDNIQSNLRQIYLRRTGTQLGLTAAGRTVADAVDHHIGPVADELLSCILEEEVTHAQLDEFSEYVSLQAAFCRPEEFAEQLEAVQRLFLGFVEWDSSRNDVVLTEVGEKVGIPALSYPEHVIGGVHHDQKQREDIASNVHVLRRGWGLFILRVLDLLESGHERVALDQTDQAVFEEFRVLARAYWLQGYAAYALRSLLSVLYRYLDLAEGLGVTRRSLEAVITDTDELSATVDDALAARSSSGGKALPRGVLARELALNGEAPMTSVEPAISENEAGLSAPEVGELRTRLKSVVKTGWHPIDGDQVTLPALKLQLDETWRELAQIGTQAAAEPLLRQATGQGLVALMLVDQRYRNLTTSYPDVDTLLRQQYGRQRSSLPALSDHLERHASKNGIASAAFKTLTDRVLETHQYVIHDRLSAGETIALAFTHDLETDTFRAEAEPGAPRTQNLRFGRMLTMLQDCNLVRYKNEEPIVTGAGHTYISRLRSGGEQ